MQFHVFLGNSAFTCLGDNPLTFCFVFIQGFLKIDRWLYDQNLNPHDDYLRCQIALKVPLVGIGAPVRAFLPQVARALGVTAIFPDHYEVANAVGTVVSSVMVRQNGEVFPELNGSVVTSYLGRVASHQRAFENFPQAVAYVREALTRLVAEEAHSAGASTPLVECEQVEVLPGTVAHFSAWAVGQPG